VRGDSEADPAHGESGDDQSADHHGAARATVGVDPADRADEHFDDRAGRAHRAGLQRRAADGQDQDRQHEGGGVRAEQVHRAAQPEQPEVAPAPGGGGRVGEVVARLLRDHRRHWQGLLLTHAFGQRAPYIDR
jgi:hypothetical protein